MNIRYSLNFFCDPLALRLVEVNCFSVKKNTITIPA